MPRKRDGNRKKRGSFPRRVPDLGFYFVVTDTKETEKNYLIGLRNSLPEGLQERLVIKVSSVHTEELIAACEEAEFDPQHRELWIVFDRDKVVSFDKIIEDAEREGIKVGWSNPCIEIWFSAYWGKLLPVQNSVACCQKFAELFEKKTGQEYKKTNQQIYTILNRFGDETVAINAAESRLNGYLSDGSLKPSQMCPATTLHHLIAEIQAKVEKVSQKAGDN